MGSSTLPEMDPVVQPPMVVVKDVSKTFHVPEERRHTLKERVLHPRRRIRKQSFKALDGISFEIDQGEFFGIAGRNGSGKSTLLKCLAGIYKAEGQIWRRGRMSTLIELGVGFNPDMAARDNVVLNGIMMGLTPREARRRYDQVIDFAELEDFQDLKLKNYSSGMHVRLAFSVAIQVDADLILVDEILAVGDASFQQKCFDVFNQMRDEGKTVVFVTHDMGVDAAILQPSPAAGARGADPPRRSRGGGRPVPGAQLRPSARDDRHRQRRRSATGRPRSRRSGSRTPRAIASRRCARARS